MELTKAELKRVELETGQKCDRINAFVGDGMTAVTDTALREQFVSEIIASIKMVAEGRVGDPVDIDADIETRNINDIMQV